MPSFVAMEALVHLVFTFCKVSIQASIYALLLLVLVQLLGYLLPSHLLVQASRNTKRFWWTSGFLISVALFIFSFTYWGNHGLGDYSRIPLGYGEAMEEMNGTMTYFEPIKNIAGREDNPEIIAYQLRNDVLCAALGSDSTFFVYDLASKRSRLFDGQRAYNDYAHRANLPTASHFEPFAQQYTRYWNGWRFWLLA
ncbi:hypothetical protein [Hymenobacter persicinus]|uniref:Uncharacterized protein n=1 Tax=Hymenobacter persicinus TaxID=2025506 RepID=A0A4Q5L6K9_9BACT|nr:hypothetical protein [Hymenobacter persicinus]RYU75458.1 hypothetical protein EWM57_19895 [Hymenobacter persicinus]